MMRPQALVVRPQAPSELAFAITGEGEACKVDLSWVDNSINEASFTVQTAPTVDGPWTTQAVLAADTTTCSHVVGSAGGTYVYRVFASNAVGDTVVHPAPSLGFPTATKDSEFSNRVEVALP